MIMDYKSFFEEIKKFKEEQNKQKQRGLNDFNILTAVRKPHAEVGMHSNFIYALLNPNGLHYQDDLFVDLFIKYVLKINDFGKVTKVSMEEPTSQNRRIDFTIQSENYSIGIEMKIYANDQDKQIYDYYNFLAEESKDDNKDVVIYYLTLNKTDASIESHNYTRYEKISFKNEILEWLEKCKNKVQDIGNLNEAIKQYIEVVKMVTNQHTSNVKNLKELLLKDNNMKLILSSEMKDAIIDSKNEVEKYFWEELKYKLYKNGYNFDYVNYDFKLEENLDDYIKNNRKWYGLKYDLLDIDTNHKLYFYIEKENNITYGLTIAENGVRKNISKNEEFKEYLEKYSKICSWTTNNKDKNNPWWLHWNYPKNKINFNEFSSATIFNLIDDMNNNKSVVIDELIKEIINLKILKGKS